MVDKRKEETEQRNGSDMGRIVWVVAPFVIVFSLLLVAACWHGW
jgi:hypothetical protein